MYLSRTIETNEFVESNGYSEGADNDNGSLILCVENGKKFIEFDRTAIELTGSERCSCGGVTRGRHGVAAGLTNSVRERSGGTRMDHG